METPLHTSRSSDCVSLDEYLAPDPQRAGDAVGVPKWFVAIVGNNSERAIRDRLSTAGFEAYVASQLQLRLWNNGRRKPVEKVLIPTCVFLRCTEAERRRIVTLPYIKRFLSDRARAKDGLAAPPAVIPEKEMDNLRFILGQSDYPVTFSNARLRTGDKVRVVRGALRGLQGEVLSPDSSEIIIRLDILGAARVSVSRQDLSPI